MPLDVTIIGGGLAGLAAAVALAPAGVRVTILEARPRLGGRASSFTDPVSGEQVDACQHVSLGCCTRFAAFAETIGVSKYLEKQAELRFVTADGRLSRMRRDPWPAPFHLGRSLAAAHYLSVTEKLRIGWGLLQLWREPPDFDPPLLKWLRENYQSPRCIERFWRVVLTSALNADVCELGLKYARKVFVDAFLMDRDGFVVEVPTVPLGRLYGDELNSWLRRHRVEVNLDCAVRRLIPSPPGSAGREGRVRGDLTPQMMMAPGSKTPLTPAPLPPKAGGEGTQRDFASSGFEIELRNGNRFQAGNIILTVPFDRVLPLLPENLQRDPFFARISKLEPSPITSVHFWFDRDCFPHPHAVLVEALGQWVFRRDNGYVQVVVSASQSLKTLGKEEIERRILAELRRIFPEVHAANLLRSRVVTEHAATFRAVPGVDEYRPAQRTPAPGLALAGDWTSTGWPATMEGAVRSGELAAAALLNS